MVDGSGMYVSDEPGYYKDGNWGIRLESDLIATFVDPASFPGAYCLLYVGASAAFSGRWQMSSQPWCIPSFFSPVAGLFRTAGMPRG